MSHTILTPGIIQASKELQPLVAALNSCRHASSIACDYHMNQGDKPTDPTVLEAAREVEDVLFTKLCSLAHHYNLDFRFDRLSDKFVLLDYKR